MGSTSDTLQIWQSAQGINFINEEAKQAYIARTKRIADAIQLKIPDRVPIIPSFGLFPAISNGFTCEEAMFDYGKANKAWMKTLTDFEPDAFISSGYAMSGPTLKKLDYKQLLLPGRDVSADHVYQFVEGEYVKAEEFYDAFIDDPSDFMLRTYLPRICGTLSPLANIRPISESFGYYIAIVANMATMGMPDVVTALRSLADAAEEANRWMQSCVVGAIEIMSMGYPVWTGSSTAAPFDIIGDFLRGTRGVMLDMYKHPDKIIKAMDKLLPILIKIGVDQARITGFPLVGIMLHKGGDSFMSDEQYRRFYWPTLRELMMGLIDEGLVPMPLFEGRNNTRLEIISDIPRGKAIYWFEDIDIDKAAEILGDKVCFRGNVPVSLLCTGTPEEVKAYVKNLIDVWGKNGGLIVDSGAWFDEAKYENVKAMVEFTKEYGVYN